MKFRVRDSDRHFYLNQRKDSEYKLMLYTGLHLSESFHFPKEHLSQLRVMLQNRDTVSILRSKEYLGTGLQSRNNHLL